MLKKEMINELGCYNTYTEIFQQPTIWNKTYDLYSERIEKIEKFLQKIDTNTRIIFTGAGSSEYVGNCIVDYLNQHSKYNFESIATTDLVSCPRLHFKKDQKTLLVSFARSGNSPESLAAVNLGEQLVDDFYNLAITCAKDGKLAVNLKDSDNSFVFNQPEESNDKAFAMTSSFSSMILSALLIFDETVEDKKKLVEEFSTIGQNILDRSEELEKLIDLDFDRIVYLGSGPLYKLTNEARLKILELTAGDIVTCNESSMGFRHGPKSFINDKTALVSFISNDEYTSLYDVDILKEVKGDDIAQKIIAISSHDIDADVEVFKLNENKLDDMYLLFADIIVAQIFSLITSLRVGNTPDTPSKTRTVNRVVKGVVIHEL